MTFKVAISQPIIYSVTLAIIFIVWDLQSPKWVAETTKILGGIAIPVLLITLGIALGQIKASSLKRSVPLSIFRLPSGFGIGVLVAELLGLEGVARGVVILQ